LHPPESIRFQKVFLMTIQTVFREFQPATEKITIVARQKIPTSGMELVLL